MKIKSLKIQNFLTIGDSGLLSLDGQGLVLVQGENRDDPSAKSNGAGKSSIVDALCWALFGETARGESGDAVVNLTGKKNCRVMVEIEDGSVVYFIFRHRKHDANKNATVVLCGAKDISKATERETQALIESILGCSRDVFMASIYAGQEQMPDLPGMTDKQLKVLIEEAAGVSRLEAAYRVALMKKNGSERLHASLQATQRGLEAGRSHASSTLFMAEKQRDDFEAQRTVRAQAANDEAKDLFEQARSAKVNLSGIDVAEQQRIIEDADEQIVAIKPLSEKLAAYVAGECSAAHRLLVMEDASVVRLADQLKQRLKNFHNAQEALEKPCPECGKPHTPDELDAFKEQQRKLIKEAKDHYDQACERQKTAQKALDLCQDKRAELEKAIPDVASLHAARKAAEAKLKQAQVFKDQVRDLVAKSKAAGERASHFLSEANPHVAKWEHLRDSLADFDAKIEAGKTAIEKAEIQFEIDSQVAEVFSPAGVRAHILDTVTPFLNERTAHYLGTLSDGNITAVWSTLTRNGKGELREKFNIEVANRTGAQSFKGLSGGEKRKVRLATMLALQDLVASRATKPIELWIGDEIDHALDEAGLERLMTVLDAKAREKGTVLVISHNSLSDWCDQVCAVIKEGGISKVEGALVN